MPRQCGLLLGVHSHSRAKKGVGHTMHCSPRWPTCPYRQSSWFVIVSLILVSFYYLNGCHIIIIVFHPQFFHGLLSDIVASICILGGKLFYFEDKNIVGKTQH